MKILMVCLGNICRSPLAEGILKHKIKQHNLKAEVDSAGTSSLHQGNSPDKRSILVAKKHGIDISKLIGRKFTSADFDNFDLIYVMDTTNLADVLFLARNESDREKVELILNMVEPHANKSVPDPYWGGEDGFENMYQMLDKACDEIIEDIKHSK
jgi:protein-tyrosine phosphatase